MTQNPLPDKNDSAEDQAIEQHVKEMLGPSPRESLPTQAVAESTPQPLPVASLSTVAPTSTDDTEPPKERVLVIPSSHQAVANVPEATPPAQPETVSDPSESMLLAGDTVVPTDPRYSSEVEVIEPGKPPTQDKHNKYQPKGGKVRQFFGKWWHNRRARRLTILAIPAILLIIAFIPATRYFILNNVGVRSSASLTVLDESTQLPLKNVEVSLAGQTAKTDTSGNVKLEHVKLGHRQLNIQKRAFATVSKGITIGWGSNKLGNFKIQPTGSQYTIYSKDWLSGKTIAGSSASGGDADANSDLNGKILITIDTTLAQQDSLSLTIHAEGYRDEQFTLDLSSQSSHTINMVTSRKDVFVSSSSGKYDVYSIDVDGKNKKLVLAGSGLEKDDIVLVQHPTDNRVALVSTRVNARNSDNYLLSTLTLIDLSDNTTNAIAQSEQVQIVGWVGSRLLYVQIAAGASATDPRRFALMSFDYKSGDKKTLASANAFNDIMLDGSYVYYAPSSTYQKDPSAGLIRSNADGSIKKTLLANEVWNIFRVGYDSLILATDKDWFEHKIGSSADPTKLSEEPANPKNRLYITSPDGKHSLWVDQRDGKGLLINYDTAERVDTTLETQKGLIYPVKWLNNEVLIYRIKSDDQTADYALNINGGSARKVTDLYNATGIDRWYYY